MSRRLKVSSAQLGPIHRADSRASVVKRMIEMLKEADSRGSKFVVFPELALPTFFPRYKLNAEHGSGQFLPCESPDSSKPKGMTAPELQAMSRFGLKPLF